jgi:hypothetical protein
VQTNRFILCENEGGKARSLFSHLIKYAEKVLIMFLTKANIPYFTMRKPISME